MKNYIGFSLLSIFLAVASCSDDDLVIQEPDQEFLIDDNGFSSIVLNFSFPENPAFTLTWSEGEVSGDIYEVVMSPTSDFETILPLGSSSTNSFTISVEDLNDALLDAGAEPFQSFSFYIRVESGSDITEGKAMTVTTYSMDPPVFSEEQDGAEIVLDGDEPDGTTETLTWEDFSFDYDVYEVIYEVEAALSGTDFADPVSAGTVSNTQEITWTHAQLNTLALNLGIAEEATGKIDLRIKSSIISETGEMERILSDPIAISMTTYSTALKDLFFVGSATMAGWNNNNNNNPAVRNPGNKYEYTYTGYFLGGGDNAFKLLEIKGQWQPQWGTNGGNTVDVNPGDGSDPGTFNTGSTGYFTFVINVQTLTYSITPYDAGSAPTYSTIGYIGSATPGGWDNDTNMTQSLFDDHIWYASNVTLTDGEMKFRAEDSWTTNWGSNTAISGQGSFGGANIPVTAGTYDIWFYDLDGRYILIPVD